MTRNQLVAVSLAVIIIPFLIIFYNLYSSVTRDLTYEIVEVHEKYFKVRITNTSPTKKFEGYVRVQEGTAYYRGPLIVQPGETIYKRLPRPNLKKSDPPPMLRMWFEYHDWPGD